MRIGLFDPYLDTLGGGERYIFSIASCLASQNKVDIFWDDISILHKAEEKFGLSLNKVQITRNIFKKKTSLLARMIQLKNYNAIFYVSDGSLPFLFAKKNILIFQFPVNWVRGNVLLSKIKLRNISNSIVYSDFVKKFIDRTFTIQSQVIPPAVTPITNLTKKENIILTVGRFTGYMNAKKQEVLIEAFKKLSDKGYKNWKFILLGSYLPQDREYVVTLKHMVGSYPIEIITGSSFEKLSLYYGKAKMYWHGAGFGEDLSRFPEKAEHFGITTVEAMSAGVVPVVFNGGGQKEIIKDGENGFTWETVDILVARTQKLIENTQLWEKMSLSAQERSKDFSPEKFCETIAQLLI